MLAKIKDKFQPRYDPASGAEGCSAGPVPTTSSNACSGVCGSKGLETAGVAAAAAVGRGGTTTGIRGPGLAGASKNKPLPCSRRPGVKATWVGVCGVWLAGVAGIWEMVAWYAPATFACGREAGTRGWALELGGMYAPRRAAYGLGLLATGVRASSSDKSKGGSCCKLFVASSLCCNWS